MNGENFGDSDSGPCGCCGSRRRRKRPSMPAASATMQTDQNIANLLSSFDKIRAKLRPEEEDHSFLQTLLASKELQALVQVHNKVAEVSATEGTDKEKVVVSATATSIAEEVCNELKNRGVHDDAKDLYHILSNPHMKALLSAHDDVAGKNYSPVLPDDHEEVDEDEVSVKIVKLIKTSEPLGATIKKDERTGQIVIARIMHGGCADRSGLIGVGDQVLEVNSFAVHGKKPDDVVRMLGYTACIDKFEKWRITAFSVAEAAQIFPRLLTLVDGPPGVGRNELKHRLIASNPDHFKTPIPHTSRPKKPTEVEGKEYVYVSRVDMEADIQLGKFMEHGEYRGNLYGTNIDSVKGLVNAGHVCVMNPHPEALKRLRSPDVRPYIVFIKPPPLDRLRETRMDGTPEQQLNHERTFTEAELEEMVRVAEKLESAYYHFFDHVLVNDDLDEATNELLQLALRIENEAQWVPASWER
ncbi:PREDICTED: MAGUK p55 subfamily member 7-like [Priapulus caudatus]|uniref:MAGUK p55 subfamily member 7-like n=1 Tax=Priapulus caudatus TaxID=37621 RepID=A0ABM1DNW2_PRICU|nr:PREDICTED: MAGUK p55 subfamily member 7-like [Priapulus caudatus]